LRRRSTGGYNPARVNQQSPPARGTFIVIGCLSLLLGAAVLAGWWLLRARPPQAAPMTVTPAVAAPGASTLVTSTPGASTLGAPTLVTSTLGAPTPGASTPTRPLPPAAVAPTPTAARPTLVVATAVPGALIDAQPPPARAQEDYERLFTTILPPLDPLALAAELDGVSEPAVTATATPAVGDWATFQTSEGPRQAELIYADDLAAYWVESGLSLDQAALIASAGWLRQQATPLLSALFGEATRLGLDGDPRVHILHLLGSPDADELGYFRDENQYPRWLESDSNEREMIYLNMARLTAGTPLYEGTLAHEMQHLIQWSLDANEDAWLNEGLSQVAETLVGLDTVDATYYREQPYIRLDRWSDAAPDVDAHYAGSYLYVLYLWEQAGDAALSELARQPANGLAAVRAVLAGHRPQLSWEEFTGDWAAAVALNDRSVDPRYGFRHPVDLGQAFLANRVRRLPFVATTTLDQMAVDMIDLDFSGPATLSFAGDATAALIDGPPPAGEAFWFAPPGNSSRAQLTAEVDLTTAVAPALDFAVWHDLEPTYDFAYLSASTDGGQTWTVISPGQSLYGRYGPAWGGPSAGWRQETVPLDDFAGGTVRLRFDVMTDFEGLGRGFAVSGLAVSGVAIQPLWQADGFVETGAVLPQRWELRLIRKGAAPEVVRLMPDASGRGEWAVDLGPDGGMLVVMPVTPLVVAPADYWLRVDR